MNKETCWGRDLLHTSLHAAMYFLSVKGKRLKIPEKVESPPHGRQVVLRLVKDFQELGDDGGALVLGRQVPQVSSRQGSLKAGVNQATTTITQVNKAIVYKNVFITKYQ